jgi:hypothetical protein
MEPSLLNIAWITALEQQQLPAQAQAQRWCIGQATRQVGIIACIY